MYEQTLPPSFDSPAVAAAWARGIALAEHPGLDDVASAAEQLARDLVAQAVPRTVLGGLIHAKVTVTDAGLRIEVSDPSGVQTSDSSRAARMSGITTTFGSQAGPDGHMVWAEVKVA